MEKLGMNLNYHPFWNTMAIHGIIPSFYETNWLDFKIDQNHLHISPKFVYSKHLKTYA